MTATRAILSQGQLDCFIPEGFEAVDTEGCGPPVLVRKETEARTLADMLELAMQKRDV